MLGAIEAALTKEQRASLSQLLRIARLDPDFWLAAPALAQTFGLMAWFNARLEYVGQGMSTREAGRMAAQRIGLPEGTIDTWQRRWQKHFATAIAETMPDGAAK